MEDKIRLIKYDELNKLLELYKHLNPEDPDIKNSDFTEVLWNEIFNDPNLHYIVVEDNGILISSCTVAIIKNLTRGGRPYALIENMVTHTDYRKRGYGKAVLEMAVEIAKDKNCYKVMLLTGRKDENTLHFYESAGFDRYIKTGFIKKLV